MSAWSDALLQRLLYSPDEIHRVGQSEVPLVLCSWKRPALIANVLHDLVSQTGAPDLAVLVWNNHLGGVPQVDRAVAAAQSMLSRNGPIRSVSVVHSAVNFGGLARFVVGRHLVRAGHQGPMVMVDDDMVLEPTFVSTLLHQWTSRSFVGVWSFAMGERGYWDRRQLDGSGETADYVGTGGSIVDLDVFNEDEFFNRLPERFAMLEDIWLSRWVAARGWRLSSAEAPHRFVEDKNNQALSLIDRKPWFWSIVDDLVAGQALAAPPHEGPFLPQPSQWEVMRQRAAGVLHVPW